MSRAAEDDVSKTIAFFRRFDILELMSRFENWIFPRGRAGEAARIPPFWALQVFGWSAYFLIHVLVLVSNGTWTSTAAFGYLCATAAGFGVTLGLRLVFRRWFSPPPSVGLAAAAVLAASFIVANAVMLAADAPKVLFWGWRDVFGPMTVLSYLQRLYWWLLYCAAWSVLYVGILFWREWQSGLAKTERAMARVQAARVRALRFRLNPRFVFEALRSVEEMLDRDKAGAKALVTELSEYLRYTLVRRDSPVVSLAEEIDALRHYLAVEDLRRGHSLEVEIAVEPDAAPRLLPARFILALAESAIEDAADGADRLARFRIDSRAREGRWRIQVEIANFTTASRPDDSAPSFSAAAAELDQRLEEVYQGRHRLALAVRDAAVIATYDIEVGP